MPENPAPSSAAADTLDCSIHRSFEGYEFQFAQSTWKLSRDVSVRVGRARSLMGTDAYGGLLATLAQYAETGSASHTANLLDRFVALLRYADSQPVTPKVVIAYREIIGPSKEWYLGVIRILLNRWLELGLPGVDPEVVALLNGWRLRWNTKGDIVKRLDPTLGALSDLELQAILEKVPQAYEQGALSVTELSLTLLTAASGRRSVQLTALKVIDLQARPTQQKGFRYFVNVPRAKQSGSEFRSVFREFEVTEELWGVLQAQKDFAVATVAASLWCEMPEELIPHVPLYPNLNALTAIDTVTALKLALKGDYLHAMSTDVSHCIKHAIQVAGVVSERTGRPLQITPRRFRYTLGTRAAREGCSEWVIAELLDHTDTQVAHVYIQNIPEYAARIEDSVGRFLVPFAHAFAGVLVDSKQKAQRGDVPGSDIRDFSGRGTGTCGHDGQCSANVPVPCYTCIHFQPWLEGPHELIYSQLVNERDRVMEVTADQAIAAVLDRSIGAVNEVIQACHNRKEVLAAGAGGLKESSDG